MAKRFFTGIGSRDIPEEVKGEQRKVSRILEEMGFTLRSGNATGSDQSFAEGIETNAQIWLPWRRFEIEFQRAHPKHTYLRVSDDDYEAHESVAKYHPQPYHLMNDATKRFMARNYRQVVGKDEPNSEFVLYWTHGGKDMGGTSQALRIADDLKIPRISMWSDIGLITAQSIIDQLITWHGI